MDVLVGDYESEIDTLHILVKVIVIKLGLEV